MDFQKSIFWICFIITIKINFLVFDLNPIRYTSARYFAPLICNNIPIEQEILNILTHLIQRSENGHRKTVDGD